MSHYFLRKIGWALLTVAFVVVLNFFLFRILPGDPARAVRDPRLTQQAVEAIRVRFGLDQPLYTTDAVLRDAFHLLAPGSTGAAELMRFVAERYVALIGLEHADHLRAFELMEQYADRPMDYADASVVVVAERLETLQVFTLDTGDFATYQIKKGHRYYRPIILGS